MRKSFLAEVNPDSIDIRSVSSRVKNKLEQIKSYNSSLKQSKDGGQVSSNNKVEKKENALTRTSAKQFVREPRAKDNAFNRQVNKQLSKLKTRKSSALGKNGKLDLQGILDKVNGYRDSIAELKNPKTSEKSPFAPVNAEPKAKPTLRSTSKTTSEETRVKPSLASKEANPRSNVRASALSKRSKTSSYKSKYQKLSPRRVSALKEGDSSLDLRAAKKIERRKARSLNSSSNRAYKRASFSRAKDTNVGFESLSPISKQEIKERLIQGLNSKADFLESIPNSYGALLQSRANKQEKVQNLEANNIAPAKLSLPEDNKENDAIARLEEKVQLLIDSQGGSKDEVLEENLGVEKAESAKQALPSSKKSNYYDRVASLLSEKGVNYQKPYEAHFYKSNTNNKFAKPLEINRKSKAQQGIEQAVDNSASNVEHSYNANNKQSPVKTKLKSSENNFRGNDHRGQAYVERYEKEPRNIRFDKQTHINYDEPFDEKYLAQNIDINNTPVVEDDISKDVLLTMLQSMLSKDNGSKDNKDNRNIEILMQQLINTLQNQDNKKDSLQDVLIAQMIAQGNNNNTNSAQVSNTDVLLGRLVDKIDNNANNKSTDMVLAKLLENSLNNNNNNSSSSNDSSNLILSKLLDNALAGANNKQSSSNSSTDLLLTSMLNKLNDISSAKNTAPVDNSLNVEIAKISSHLENDRYNQNQRYLQDILHEVKSSKNQPAGNKESVTIDDVKLHCNKIEKANSNYIADLEQKVNSVKVTLEEKLSDLQKGFNVDKIKASLVDLEENISSGIVEKVENIIDEKIENFGSNIKSLQSNIEEQKILTKEDVDAKLESIESYINGKLTNSEVKIDETLEDSKKLLEKQEEMVAKVLDNETSFIENLQLILEKLNSKVEENNTSSQKVYENALALAEQVSKQEANKQQAKPEVDFKVLEEITDSESILEEKESSKPEEAELKTVALPKENEDSKEVLSSTSASVEVKETQKELLDNLAKISEVSKHLEKIKQEQEEQSTVSEEPLKKEEQKQEEVKTEEKVATATTNKLFTFNKNKEQKVEKVETEAKEEVAPETTPILVENTASETKAQVLEIPSLEEDKKETKDSEEKPSYNTKDVFSFLNKPSAKVEEEDKKEEAKEQEESKEVVLKGDVLVPDYIPLGSSRASDGKGKTIKAVWSDENVEEELKNKWNNDKDNS